MSSACPVSPMGLRALPTFNLVECFANFREYNDNVMKKKAPYFNYYLGYSPKSRKLTAFLGWALVFIGFLYIGLGIYLLMDSDERTRSIIALVLPLFLLLVWPLSAMGLYVCYFSHFRLEDGIFEVRLSHPGEKFSCPRKEVFSFGQAETGTIALFGDQDRLLLYMPLPYDMTKEAFLGQIRSLLVPLLIEEIPMEKVESLLCQKGVY